MIELPNLPNAACRDHPAPDVAFFPAGHQQRSAIGRQITIEARELCGRCPENLKCLSWALDRNEEGIWAGTDEDERRRLNKGRPLTQEARRRAVRRLNREGRADSEIAEDLNVSRSVITHDRSVMKIAPAGTYAPQSIAERRRRVSELHSQGLNDPQIADVLGCDRSTARMHRRALGLPAHPRGGTS